MAFLAGQTCTIAGKKLEPWFSTQEVGVCHAGQACTNGAAYLVSGRSALPGAAVRNGRGVRCNRANSHLSPDGSEFVRVFSIKMESGVDEEEAWMKQTASEHISFCPHVPCGAQPVHCR